MSSSASQITAAIDGARFGRPQLLIAALCALVALLDGFDTQSIAFVAPMIAEQWRLSPASFGPIFGIGLLGLTIGAFVLGPAADRFGRKAIILLSIGIFGVFALLTAWAASVPELMLLRFLTGIGLGGAMPNIIALTSEYAPARLKATLVTVMFCGFPLGSTLGGLISAPLIAQHGWPAVFLLGGVLPLLLLPVLVIALPESARFLATRPGTEAKVAAIVARLGLVPAATPALAAAVPDSQGFPVFALFRDGRARMTALLWLAFFMNLLVMYFLVNWLPSLLRAGGQPIDIAILATAILNAGGVVGGIVLGQAIDRFQPHAALGGSYLAAAACIAVAATHATELPLLLAAIFFAGFGVVGAQIGMNALVAATYPTEMRATAVGWALGVGRVGAIFGPVAGGWLLAAGWTSQSLVLAAAAPAVCAGLAVLALRQRRGAQPAPAPQRS
jgi:AAHS family 4-hydroxybenzoate transporter-like MFS transporter